MSFKELKIAELRAVAKAFAVDEDDVVDKSNAATLQAALAESGVTWEMYQEMFFPDVEPEPVENISNPAPGVLVSDTVLPKPLAVEPEEVVIITKEEYPKLTANEQYLVKMVRENPYFEIEGLKFTQEHPYNLMDANKAERVLREEGFRQALPSEVQEYYG